VNETFWSLSGTDWALFGAATAAILGGIGSAMGITIAASTASGILSEDDTKFGQLLPIAAMPGTQGIYGFIAAVLVVVFFNILGGTVTLGGTAGFQVFLACQPVGWLCLISAIYQGRTGSSAAGIVAAGKRAPALVFPALVETYAILALIVTILMLLGLQAAYVK
jgi:V/A-type H+/Na+-transporting ATPase subunit K